MMTDNGPLYGNEWIESGKTYLRVPVAADGLYRVDAATLRAAGLGDGNLEVHHNGKLVAAHATADGVVFYGQRARGELDAHFFTDPARQQLNPRYGMHNDTAAYYLSAGTGGVAFELGTAAGGGQPLDVVLRQSEQVFSEGATKFYRRSSGTSVVFSRYQLAEGFGSLTDRDLLKSDNLTETTVDLPLPGATGAAARLELRFGLAFDAHLQEIRIDGALSDTVRRFGWDVVQRALDFTPRGEEVTLAVRGTAGERDKANLAYVRVTYPAAATVDGAEMAFALPAGGAVALTLNDPTATDAAVLYDLAAARYYVGRRSAGAVTFDLPARTTVHDYVYAGGAITPASPPVPVTLTDPLPPAEATYLIVSSRRLAGGELDELAAYRASATGGGHRVHVAYIEDLYDHFSYGQNRHNLALRNYLDAAVRRAPALNYLFIVGKGREYRDLRSTDALAAARSTFFIPSYGYPAADLLLTAAPGSSVHRLATGRLAAINTAEIGIYARKLREVESQIERGGQTIEDRDWMKHALHLGGGQTPAEQSAIRRNLENAEAIFENGTLGGDVYSFYRSSSEPIETSRQEDIFNRINEGVSLITFHGHSSSQGFDFNIDNPANYKNRGKYPHMTSLGCYSGDAFTQERSISERFIFLPDGGAITFAASKGLGYITALGTYARSFYRQAATDLYGHGVGDMLRAVNLELDNTSNFTLELLLEQFALSGDPAFRLHPRPGPDLIVDPTSVRFNPTVVSAQDSFFTATLRVLNLGSKAEDVADSMTLQFRQRLPGGALRDLLRYRVAVPPYDELLTLRLPNLGLEAVGENRILITVDRDDEVAERPAGPAEGNNELLSGGQAGVPLTVVANTARVAFPPRYATVGPGFELIASTTDPTAPARPYRLEVATRSDFSAPLVALDFTAPGGLIRVTPDLPATDSTTYYWRISPDSTNARTGYIWSESSFTFVRDQSPARTGWAQQHPGQLIDGTFTNVAASASVRGWNFEQNVNDFEIINAVYRSRFLPQMTFNGRIQGSAFPWRTRAGIQVLVIDSTDNELYYPSIEGQYNSRGSRLPWTFDTRTDGGRAGLIQFLDEGIEPGRYVFVFSIQRGDDIEYHSEDWLQDSTRLGQTIYGALEREGAEQARLLAQLGSVPYIFAYQKGLGPIAEAVATAPTDTIRALMSLRENWAEGTFVPTRIGPALDWESLDLGFSDRNLEAADSAYFRLFGETAAGDRTLLREEYLEIGRRRNFSYDLREYGEFPYLSTTLELYDSEQRTVATLDHLYVDYRRPADVAVNPEVALSVPDSIIRGQAPTVDVGYENISRTDMDSLLVRLRVIDRNNAVTNLQQRYPPLAAGATGRATFTLPPGESDGGLRLQLTLNPDQDQPEEITFNNSLATGLDVLTDEVAPSLQVYFDGRRIRDGELISSEPEILVQLRDDSKFLRLDDSSAYIVELTDPGGVRERIELSDPRIEFLPAGADGENLAEIYFRPELPRDGKYVLTVRARDRAGNRAGRSDFRKEFEVINEQLIANVLTYPNPFTTATRFVYTLTGSVPPDVFRIQIMTVSGRVVRDIDLLAHEDIRIGTHQTEFAWDGTDEYGDALANGVYLYRVITSDAAGERLENYDTGTDRFFANGTGKVVILR